LCEVKIDRKRNKIDREKRMRERNMGRKGKMDGESDREREKWMEKVIERGKNGWRK
jgi:hypothetical protein